MQPIQVLSSDLPSADASPGAAPQKQSAVGAEFVHELMARLTGHRQEAQAQMDRALLADQSPDGTAESGSDQGQSGEVILIGADGQAQAPPEELFPTGSVVEGQGIFRGQALVVASASGPVSDNQTGNAPKGLINGNGWAALAGGQVDGGRQAVPHVLLSGDGQKLDGDAVKPSGAELSARPASARPFFEDAPHIDWAAQAVRTRLKGSLPEVDADRVLEKAMGRALGPAGLPENAKAGDAIGLEIRRLMGAMGIEAQGGARAAAEQVRQLVKGQSDSSTGAQQGTPHQGNASFQGASLAQQGDSQNRQAFSQNDQETAQETAFRSQDGSPSKQVQAGAQAAAQGASARPASSVGENGNFSQALAALTNSRGAEVSNTPATAGTGAASQTLRGTEPDQVFDQIVRSARLFQSQEGQNFEIRLKPEFLGRIRIETLLSADNKLTTRLIVEDPEVRALLEHRLPALADRLSDGGVRIQSVEIQSMHSGEAGRSQADAQQQQQRQAERQETEGGSSETSRQEDSETSPDETSKYRPSHQGRISLVA